MAQKLFVGGIAFTTTEGGLHEFFGQAGEVSSASIVTDRDTGRSRGFGFVEMTDAEGAQRAVATLNGRDLDGRLLKVELAKPKGQRLCRSAGPRVLALGSDVCKKGAARCRTLLSKRAAA